MSPKAYLAGQQTNDANFKFTILDHRGLVANIGGQTITGRAFNSSNIDKRSANGTSLTLNAQDGQIRSSVTRTVLVELVDGGAAPAQVTVTVQPNITATDGDFGGTTS